MCGERNMVGTPVICVYAPDTRRQYYCMFCWNEISARAEDDVPELAEESEADVQMIGMIFGIKEMKNRDKLETRGKLEALADGRIADQLDIQVHMKKSLLVDNIPFKRWHLTGDELEAHREKVKTSRVV